MKKLTKIALVVFAGIALVSCGGNTDKAGEENEIESNDAEMKPSVDGTYAVSTADSKLMWEGNMLKLGGVSLYGHNGEIGIQKGELMAKEGKLTGGMVIIDMKSIKPMDDNYDPEENHGKDDLIGHLSSDDFFAVEQHPTAMFEITGSQDDKIMGNMTIRGVTNPETIENVKMEMVDGKLMAKGEMTLDRQKYDVKFKAGEDKVLSDDLDFEFSLVAMQN